MNDELVRPLWPARCPIHQGDRAPGPVTSSRGSSTTRSARATRPEHFDAGARAARYQLGETERGSAWTHPRKRYLGRRCWNAPGRGGRTRRRRSSIITVETPPRILGPGRARGHPTSIVRSAVSESVAITREGSRARSWGATTAAADVAEPNDGITEGAPLAQQPVCAAIGRSTRRTPLPKINKDAHRQGGRPASVRPGRTMSSPTGRSATQAHRAGARRYSKPMRLLPDLVL